MTETPAVNPASKKELIATGRLSREDLLSGMRYATWARLRTPFYAIVFSALALIVVTSIITPGAWPPGCVFFAGYLILFTLAPSIWLRRSLRSFPWVLEKVTYRFTDSKFMVERPSAQSSLAWMNVHSVAELPNGYLIFIDKRMFHVVPKRFFAPDDLSEFGELIRKVLSAHRKPPLKRANTFWARLCSVSQEPTG